MEPRTGNFSRFVSRIRREFPKYRDDTLALVRRLAPEGLVVVDIDLGGSYAQGGSPSEESDVDLVVYYRGETPPEALAGMLRGHVPCPGGGVFDIVPVQVESGGVVQHQLPFGETFDKRRFDRIRIGYGFEPVERVNTKSACSNCGEVTRQLWADRRQVPRGTSQQAYRDMVQDIEQHQLCKDCVVNLYDSPEFDEATRWPGNPRKPRGVETFEVYIAKYYFPRELWQDGMTEAFETWKVRASSRQEAADKIWAEHGERLLKLMGPRQTRLPRKVSLHVSAPWAGTGGYATRLAPLQVYVGESTLDEVVDGLLGEQRDQLVFLSGKAKPLADVEEGDYRVVVTDNRRMLYFRHRSTKPVPAGLWMGWWEPDYEKYFGVTEEQYETLSLGEQAEVEARLQLKLWVPKEYYFLYAEFYYPREYNTWWDKGGASLSVDVKNEYWRKRLAKMESAEPSPDPPETTVDRLVDELVDEGNRGKFRRGANKLVRCRGCGKLTHSSVQGCLGIELCPDCLADADAENLHNDTHDPANPVPGCKWCNPTKPTTEELFDTDYEVSAIRPQGRAKRSWSVVKFVRGKPGDEYTVSEEGGRYTCTCPVYREAGHHCKHMSMVADYERVGGKVGAVRRVGEPIRQFFGKPTQQAFPFDQSAVERVVDGLFGEITTSGSVAGYGVPLGMLTYPMRRKRRRRRRYAV